MGAWIAICSILGALLSLAAALWLLFGFDPHSARYKEIRGGGYPASDPVGLRQLIVDQGKAGALGVAGAVLQLVSVVLALIGHR